MIAVCMAIASINAASVMPVMTALTAQQSYVAMVVYTMEHVPWGDVDARPDTTVISVKTASGVPRGAGGGVCARRVSVCAMTVTADLIAVTQW